MTVTPSPTKREAEPTKERRRSTPALRVRPAWELLQKHYHDVEGLHLRQLFAEDRMRGEKLTVEAAGI